MMELAFFVLGSIVGWYTNRWFAINLRQPNLRVSGSGSGSSFAGSGYRHIQINIENELRRIGLQIPTTIILGKRINPQFPMTITEREVSKRTTARLLDSDGTHICNLYWLSGDQVQAETDIRSGESATLILFVRREGENEYFAYQSTSNINLLPRTAGAPRFTESKNFIVEVSYLYGSKRLRCPVKIDIGYHGSFSFNYGSGGGGF